MFDYLLNPIKEKLENLLKIGRYTNVNGSDGELQQIQSKTLRNIEDAMKVGQFGFNSKAPIDSRCIVAKIGNEKIVIANEHIASIIDVAVGDSVQYNEDGTFVKLEGDATRIGTTTFKVSNGLDDMTALLSDTIQFLSDTNQELSTSTVTITSGSSAGIYPLTNAANFTALKAQIEALKVRFDTFKE